MKVKGPVAIKIVEDKGPMGNKINRLYIAGIYLGRISKKRARELDTFFSKNQIKEARD